MKPGALSNALKSGAIWGFIVLELVFFSVAGEYLSLSDKAFMDWENMLLLLKQSAPIGSIAMGMTIVMVNGNIDLSVGATFAIAAIVLLDSMTWPIFAGLGDWVIPVAWLLALLVGLRAVSQTWTDIMGVYGRGRLSTLYYVRARACLPYLFVGLQISAPAAFLGAMIGEFTVAERGLGVLTLG